MTAAQPPRPLAIFASTTQWRRREHGPPGRSAAEGAALELVPDDEVGSEGTGSGGGGLGA